MLNAAIQTFCPRKQSHLSIIHSNKIKQPFNECAKTASTSTNKKIWSHIRTSHIQVQREIKWNHKQRRMSNDFEVDNFFHIAERQSHLTTQSSLISTTHKNRTV